MTREVQSPAFRLWISETASLNSEPRQYTTLLAFGQQSCTLAALFGVRRQSEAATALWIANLDFSNER